jgi:hypothetical protein
MAKQTPPCDTRAEASGQASVLERRGRRWRTSVLGLLTALLGLVVAAPLPANASAPVHVTSIASNAGPTAGGVVTVTIAGTGFQDSAHVRFCNQDVVPTSLTPVKITALAPVSSTFGPCLVNVKNPDSGISPEPVAFNYYEQLPSVPAASSASAATHTVPNSGGDTQVDVFVKGSDSNLHHSFHTHYSPSWSAWANLGGDLTSAPTAVSWGSQNRIDVFVRGSDNGLWHKWWSGSDWSLWETLGGNLSSAPVVTSWAAGRLDVFGRGTDSQLWHRSFAGGWSSWEPLGGVLNSGAAAVSWGPNRIDIFTQGTDQSVWHKWWGETSWSGWESRQGSISQAPAVTSRGPGDLEVYALGSATGHNLYHLSYSGGWFTWRGEGPYWNGDWAFSPGVASQSFLIGPETFMVGADNTVWHSVTFGARVGLPSSGTRSTSVTAH